MRALLLRELGSAFRRPAPWLLLSGYLLLAGLFFTLRLAAGEAGDRGGTLREVAAVLLPLAALLGAASLSEGPRLSRGRAAPLSSAAVVLAAFLPAALGAALAGLVGGALPLLLWPFAPVDPGRVLAGGLALAGLGATVAALGACAAAWLRSLAPAALAAFALALALFGIQGLAAALGWAGLARLDVTLPLVAGGAGWVVPRAFAPQVGVAAAALILALLGLEARRW